MKEKYRSLVAVFLILTRLNEKGIKEILLQKRKNTGYMDGMYDLAASGHLEENESLKDAVVRETLEELGINIVKEDLKLENVYHEKASEKTKNYIRFFFSASRHKGIPKIMEPEKCDELIWVDINQLPDNTIYHLKHAISIINEGINYFDTGF